MRNVVLKYGILSGLIIAVLMVISGAIGGYSEENFAMSMVLGYTTMIISLSIIFFGVRNYRDNYSGGSITFGRGFLIGLCIALIASVFYVTTWKIYSSIALPDFADKYAARVITDLKKSGASDSTVAIKTKEMAEFKQMYANPFFEIAMTFIEIFPVGLLVSLICAFILKRKPASTIQTV